MRRDFIIGSVLFLVTFAVFSPALQGEFVAFDDNTNIVTNPHIHQFTWENLKWMFTDSSLMRRYVPFSWLNWAILYQLFGPGPFSFHLENILLQAVNVALLFFLLRKILLRFVPNNPPSSHRKIEICAAFAALLWAIHPMRVEVVAWANCEMYSQTLFFALLSIWFYFRAVEKTQAAGAHLSTLGSRPLWLSALFLGVSLLTYPTCVGFVVVLLVLDIYFFKRLSPSPKNWLKQRAVFVEKIPFVFVTLGAVATTLLARAHMTGKWAASVNMSHFGLVDRAAQAGYIWTYYLWRPFWPVDLRIVYTRLIFFEPTEWIFPVSVAVIIGGTIFLFWKRKRWPLFFALWICHLVLLVPMLGLTEHPHYSCDRYNYIQSLIWSVLIAFVLIKIWDGKAGWMGVAASAAVAGFFAFSSFQQTQFWKNNFTLDQAIIDGCLRGGTELDVSWASVQYCWMGDRHAKNGRLNDAMASYCQGIKICPARVEPRDNVAALCLKPENFERAFAQLESMAAKNPKDGVADFVMGLVLERQKKIDEAIAHYRAARQTWSDNAEVEHRLGLALSKSSRPEESLEHFLAAARLDPKSETIRLNAGLALMRADRVPEAIEQFLAAVKLQPTSFEAHRNLGNALAITDKMAEALPHFVEAVRLKPDMAELYLPLGQALDQLGQHDEAIKTFRKALTVAESGGNDPLAAQIRGMLEAVTSPGGNR